MRRKSFDSLVSAAALVVAAVLLAASGLLLWANSFVSDNVRTQLTAQKIFFPPAGSESLSDPAVKPFLTQYAGEQLVNGDQAKAYADHFIAVHVKAASGGRTFAELGADQSAVKAQIAEAKAAATSTTALDEQLATLTTARETVFKGETLRGLLVNAYAFGTMAKVAFVAFWITLGCGLLMLTLAVLGFIHARRTSYDVALHVPGWHPESLPSR
ncbi:MAG: hypothetical protein H0V92_05720 [Pseudonocardiales bacterium]|nr:hypothetical protein [Pseudonocardiales bacterium]